MSENAIIHDDYFYNLKAVKTHNIAKNVNKSLLNDKGVSIGKFIQKLKGKILPGDIQKLNGLFPKIKGNHMVVLIGS